MNILIDSIRAAIASEVRYYEMVARLGGTTPIVSYAHACGAYMGSFTSLGEHNAIGMARLLLQWHLVVGRMEEDKLPQHAPWAVILAQTLRLCENDEHGSRPSPANQVSDEFAALVARRVAKKAVKHTTSSSDSDDDGNEEEAKKIMAETMTLWASLGESTPANADSVSK